MPKLRTEITPGAHGSASYMPSKGNAQINANAWRDAMKAIKSQAWFRGEDKLLRMELAQHRLGPKNEATATKIAAVENKRAALREKASRLAEVSAVAARSGDRNPRLLRDQGLSVALSLPGAQGYKMGQRIIAETTQQAARDNKIFAIGARGDIAANDTERRMDLMAARLEGLVLARAADQERLVALDREVDAVRGGQAIGSNPTGVAEAAALRARVMAPNSDPKRYSISLSTEGGSPAHLQAERALEVLQARPTGEVLDWVAHTPTAEEASTDPLKGRVREETLARLRSALVASAERDLGPSGSKTGFVDEAAFAKGWSAGAGGNESSPAFAEGHRLAAQINEHGLSVGRVPDILEAQRQVEAIGIKTGNLRVDEAVWQAPEFGVSQEAQASMTQIERIRGLDPAKRGDQARLANFADLRGGVVRSATAQEALTRDIHSFGDLKDAAFAVAGAAKSANGIVRFFTPNQAGDTFIRAQMFWNTQGKIPRMVGSATLGMAGHALGVGWSLTKGAAGALLGLWEMSHSLSDVARSAGRGDVNLTTDAILGLASMRAIGQGVSGAIEHTKGIIQAPGKARDTVQEKVDKVQRRYDKRLQAQTQADEREAGKATQGFQGHQEYMTRVEAIYKHAEIAATAGEAGMRESALANLESMKADLLGQLKTMQTKNPEIAGALEGDPTLNPSAIFENANRVAHMKCHLNEQIRGWMERAGLEAPGGRTAKGAASHGDYTNVIDFGVVKPSARHEVTEHFEDTPGASADYETPRLVCQSAQGERGKPTTFIFSSVSPEGLAGSPGPNALGLPKTINLAEPDLRQALAYLAREEAAAATSDIWHLQGFRDRTRVSISVQASMDEGGGDDSGARRRALELSGEDGSTRRFDSPEALLRSLKEAQEFNPLTLPSENVEWLRAQVPEDMTKNLEILAQSQANVEWLDNHLDHQQREAAIKLANISKSLGGLEGLRAPNPRFNTLVMDFNGSLQKDGREAAGLTVDPALLVNYLSAPSREAAAVVGMNFTQGISNAFSRAHAINENEQAIAAMYEAAY